MKIYKIAFLISIICFPALGHAENKIETNEKNSPSVEKNSGIISYAPIDHLCQISGTINIAAGAPQISLCEPHFPEKSKSLNALEKAQLAILMDDNKTAPQISAAKLGCWLGDRRTFVNLTFSNPGKRPAAVTAYGDAKTIDGGKSYKITPHKLPESGKINGFSLESGQNVSWPFISIDEIRESLNLKSDDFIYAVSTEINTPDLPAEVIDCSSPFGRITVPEPELTDSGVHAFVIDKSGAVSQQTEFKKNTKTTYSVLSVFEYFDIFGRKSISLSQFHVFTVKIPTQQ